MRRKNNLGHQRAFKDCRSRNIPKVVTKASPFCIHFSHFQGISSFLHFSFLYSSLEFQLLIESRLRREKLRLRVQIPVMNSSKHILIFQFSGNHNPQWHVMRAASNNMQNAKSTKTQTRLLSSDYGMNTNLLADTHFLVFWWRRMFLNMQRDHKLLMCWDLGLISIIVCMNRMNPFTEFLSLCQLKIIKVLYGCANLFKPLSKDV